MPQKVQFDDFMRAQQPTAQFQPHPQNQYGQIARTADNYYPNNNGSGRQYSQNFGMQQQPMGVGLSGRSTMADIMGVSNSHNTIQYEGN